MRRLDYLKGLGVTAIWMTPPLKGRPNDPGSYHGYGAQDFLEIDPHFGTTEDFREMVKQAHRRGMYVLMDIVVNHAGDVWSYEGEHDMVWDKGRQFTFGRWRRSTGNPDSQSPLGRDDGVWPVELQHPEAFKRMGRMHDPGQTKGQESTDADFYSLKTIDLERPEILHAMIQVYKYWIAMTDLDGFRIDAFRHIRPDASRAFCTAIRQFAHKIGKMNFLMIGEVAAGNEQMIKYVGSNVPLAGEKGQAHHPLLESVLDFETYRLASDVLKGKLSFEPLRNRYDFFARFYRDLSESGKYYVTFLENHDQVEKGYARFLNGVNDDRMGILGAGYLLTSMGIPCLYYGSEQGFDDGPPKGAVADDRYVRACMFGGKWGGFGTTGMQFFNPKHPIYQGIAKIASVRAQLPALRYGRQYFREVSDDGEGFGHPKSRQSLLAFSRLLDDQEVLVALNLDVKQRTQCVSLDGDLTPMGTQLRDALGATGPIRVQRASDGRAFVRLQMPGRSMVILHSPYQRAEQDS
jgi:glycosidase